MPSSTLPQFALPPLMAPTLKRGPFSPASFSFGALKASSIVSQSHLTLPVRYLNPPLVVGIEEDVTPPPHEFSGLKDILYLGLTILAAPLLLPPKQYERVKYECQAALSFFKDFLRKHNQEFTVESEELNTGADFYAQVVTQFFQNIWCYFRLHHQRLWLAFQSVWTNVRDVFVLDSDLDRSKFQFDDEGDSLFPPVHPFPVLTGHVRAKTVPPPLSPSLGHFHTLQPIHLTDAAEQVAVLQQSVTTDDGEGDVTDSAPEGSEEDCGAGTRMDREDQSAGCSLKRQKLDIQVDPNSRPTKRNRRG